MKFLLDAQLPKKLSYFLQDRGFDALHTSDLVNGNRTKDSEINDISVKEQRVVISKDMDFVVSLLLSDKPYKLLYINTGNIHNEALKKLFSKNLERMITCLKSNKLVELTPRHITTYG
ncbi:DUF5615 family PIN-like protein [Sulfurovum sp.]|uniref:DUF5615 family PIN-like protein n=1 Tax=Sulfurovum sp. TaxID=1969726 RepID=UPI0025F6A4BA|nr:DUF5615 family PIN-like protein [Sulfurovum sp.]